MHPVVQARLTQREGCARGLVSKEGLGKGQLRPIIAPDRIKVGLASESVTWLGLVSPRRL